MHVSMNSDLTYRIGIVFVFQNRLIRLFTWKTPSHTLSFLSIYTFVCLDPHLLVVIPLAALLLFVMVPAFLARHPPPPPSASTSSTTPYSYYGPALAPPRTIKPASEASKDFFRNMRDLQNSMADFATLHDSLIKLIAPPTNFSNEVLSSSLFLFLSAISASLFISAHLLPWRFIFLGLGFTVTASGHPAIQAQILHLKAQHDSDHRAGPSATSSHFTFGPFTIPTSFSGLTELLSSVASITLSTAPETREVEIFELQYRPLIPPGPLIPSAAATAAEWNPYIFTPSPYDPLSPARISGSRPPGCRFFEDVQPPRGWVWKTKKWELDLQAGEWVADRLVTGVGFEVSPTVDGNDDIHESENKNDTNARQMRKVAADVSDQFGGWVWDLPPTSSPLPALGSEPRTSSVNGLRSGKKSGGSRPRQQSRGDRDWEESTTRGPAVAARTGEWRRRRWVRMVQRVGSEVGNGEGGRDEAEAHKGQAKIGKRN